MGIQILDKRHRTPASWPLTRPLSRHAADTDSLAGRCEAWVRQAGPLSSLCGPLVSGDERAQASRAWIGPMPWIVRASARSRGGRSLRYGRRADRGGGDRPRRGALSQTVPPPPSALASPSPLAPPSSPAPLASPPSSPASALHEPAASARSRAFSGSLAAARAWPVRPAGGRAPVLLERSL